MLLGGRHHPSDPMPGPRPGSIRLALIPILVTALALALAASACSSTDETASGPAATVEAGTVSTTPFPSSISTSTSGALVVDSGSTSAELATSADPTTSSTIDGAADGSGPTASSAADAGATTSASTGPTSSSTSTPSTAVPSTAGSGDGAMRDNVVGAGTPASCTSQAVVDAVAAGGFITFDCGPAPVVITMDQTAKVVNANGPEIVLDGGGLVTLSGGGNRRILYQNTCDQAQGWTTSQCQNQDHPRLTVQNLAFIDGNATGERTEGGGGGAIFVRGGQLRVVNSTFVDNRCDATGPDVGGAAIRALSQFDGRPVEVIGSTFRGGVCSNGGALSSIGVSWRIVDSRFTDNEAIGNGANPARSGTPGGGSGGAIYTDGNRFTVELVDTVIEDNRANEGGGAVFFVSNDRSGTMSIAGSTLRRNPSAGFETTGFPGIFFLGARDPSVTGSTLE